MFLISKIFAPQHWAISHFQQYIYSYIRYKILVAEGFVSSVKKKLDT